MPPQTLTSLTSLTLISVPYHVGLRASPMHRSHVSEGPDYLKSAGLLSLLLGYGQQHNLPLPLPVHEFEIPPVEDTFEGEIGRTFELIRRVSLAVTAARDAASFPVVLAGNCCISVGVAAGLCGSRELLRAGGCGNGGDDGGGGLGWDCYDGGGVLEGVDGDSARVSAVVVEEGGALWDEGT
ncbi:hypothetical protein CHGG_10557 [Chaetomium globosum CBS 148.51]|uniref:Uncharacterized protein n=1 Tax=Chaetomium globosum (strain ATCC 6205 / CBS 148.51 / DSM 1962 / NBRC 6347 / NRRL 1970) TaxID=306901 RepID=Q2GN97_CHAGB|nr:uncharacterized protein CHGG_10557 [Chaetomium globosum CBS 148.51]EAQ84153.1 hypothetical protein CHGG_10557 [Chaetomium globosum CBS 148.51]